MNLMIEQKENYSWVTQVGLHGQTSEGLEPYKLESVSYTHLTLPTILLV